VAPLANVVFFLVMLASVSKLTSLSGGLTGAAAVNGAVILACIGALLGDVIWLMGQVPRERLLGS
jgi:hypothetical protein